MTVLPFWEGASSHPNPKGLFRLKKAPFNGSITASPLHQPENGLKQIPKADIEVNKYPRFE